MDENMRTAFVKVLKAATRATKEDIKALKKEGKQFYVIKYKDRLYVSYNIAAIRPFTTSQQHLCANCQRCRAIPTEYGGCDKIWNISGKHVYKYDFITLGVEAFTHVSDRNFFSVIGCRSFIPDPPRTTTKTVWHDPNEPYTPTYTRPRPTITIHWPY